MRQLWYLAGHPQTGNTRQWATRESLILDCGPIKVETTDEYGILYLIMADGTEVIRWDSPWY